MTDLEALKKRWTYATNPEGLASRIEARDSAEVLALIDELTEARREIAELRAALADPLSPDALPLALTNARAAMAEEVVRTLKGTPYLNDSADGHVEKFIRALAPLPPSVRCVPVETLEKLEAEFCQFSGRSVDRCQECGRLGVGSDGKYHAADCGLGAAEALLHSLMEKPR